MSNVISFQQRVAEKRWEAGVDARGMAYCMNPKCLHSWMAQAPHQLEELECEKCHTMRGVWMNNFCPSDQQLRTCNTCCSQIFRITLSGIHCVGCGTATAHEDYLPCLK